MEVFYVYGYSFLVGELVVKFVENILSDDRNVLFYFSVRSKRLGVCMILFINIILLKVGFLCNVLVEDLYCYYLVFKVCMLGLEMLR